jgi:hypothetical protein
MAALTCTHCGAGNRGQTESCDNFRMTLSMANGIATEILWEDETQVCHRLFGDLVNSTAMVADVLPEEAQQRLNPVVSCCGSRV